MELKEIEEFNDLLELVMEIGSLHHLKDIKGTAAEIFDKIKAGNAEAEEIRVALVSFYGLGVVFGIAELMKFYREGQLTKILRAKHAGEVIEMMIEHKKML